MESEIKKLVRVQIEQEKLKKKIHKLKKKKILLKNHVDAIDEFFDEKNNFELTILKRGLERCDNFKSEAYQCLDKENKKLLLKNIVEIKYEKERNKNIEKILNKGFEELKKKKIIEKNEILKEIEEKKKDNDINEKQYVIKRQNYLKYYNIDFIEGKNKYDLKNIEEKKKKKQSFFRKFESKRIISKRGKRFS